MKTTLFNTDFYQISMALVYLTTGKNVEKTGFEGFIRHINSDVNSFGNWYIFDGETEVKEYMEEIRSEMNNPWTMRKFWKLVKPKVTAPDIDKVKKGFIRGWRTIDSDFKYNVMKNGTIVKPHVPVFQYWGDKFIGQIIETKITNIYNGRTALATIKKLQEDKIIDIPDEEMTYLDGLVNETIDSLSIFENEIKRRAKEFRRSTNKILLEAGFRRAPSHAVANIASRVAIESGWNGTSNTTIVNNNEFNDTVIGGTMAHAFVMSFDREIDAFKAWNEVFPNTTILIDTYDVGNAIKSMIRHGINTKEVRIDSEPLDEYAFNVKKELNHVVDSFLSGDISPSKLIDYEEKDVPFSKVMAGTKYVYFDDVIAMLNSKFVYKIVQYEKDGKTFYPEKKSNGKKMFSGLKTVVYNVQQKRCEVSVEKDSFGYANIDEIEPDCDVVMIKNNIIEKI
jgi:nicotinate phosphoribosyltransferase